MGINMRTWISQNRKVVYAIAAVLVLIVVIWARQNRIPDFEDIGSFDSFRYELTYTKQEFKLKPHDRHWMLRRHTTYDANGNIEYQKNFELDSNNAAYYLHGDTPCYISRLPSEGFSNVTEGYPNWNIKEQRLDEYGRVSCRTLYSGKDGSIVNYSVWEYEEIEEVSS